MKDKGREVYWVWDGQQQALEFNFTGAVSYRFLYGPGVDQVLSQDNGSGGHWFLPDHLGTTRDLIDEDGDHVMHNEFDAYGRLLNSPAFTTLLLFAGREYDTTLKMYYVRARWYDPEVGRWASEDPIGFAGGDTNLSRYVANSPVNYTDPDGLAPKLPPWASERLTDDILIRVDKGPQVYGGFEVHVYDNRGNEIAKLDGKGSWCKTHSGKELMTPTKFKAKHKDAIRHLNRVMRKEAQASAEAGWRTGRKLTRVHAAKIGLTVAAVFSLGIEAANAMEAFSGSRHFRFLIKSCERGDIRSADGAAMQLYEELLGKQDAKAAIAWREAWYRMSIQLKKDMRGIGR